MPLSGKFAREGEWIKRGFELAVDKINSGNGILGRKLELIVLDDQFKEEQVPLLYRKLVGEFRADFLLGPFGSGLLMPASRIAEENDRLLFCTMSGAKVVHRQGFRNIIATITQPKYSAGVSAASFLKFLSLFDTWNEDRYLKRPRTMVLVCIDNVYGREIFEVIPEIASEYGFVITFRELYKENELPRRGLRSVEMLKPDIFMQQGYFGDAVSVMKEFISRQLYTTYMYNSGSACLPDWVDRRHGLGERGNYMYGSSYWSPRYVGGDAEYLRRTYQKRFGEEANWEVALGYSSIELLAEAAKLSGSVDNDSILRVLKTHKVEIALTPVRIAEDGANVLLDPCVAQPQKNRIEIVWPPHLATAKAVRPIPKLH